MRETLKDKNYRIIGYIEDQQSGVKVIKDSNYHICGYYYERENCTKDENYRIVGYGNLLVALLFGLR